MSYPMIEKMNFWGEMEYREMTADEYEEKLDWFRDYIKRNENNACRRIEEYVSYLRRWFSDSRCDGFNSFSTRYMLHQIPMSYNVYFN